MIDYRQPSSLITDQEQIAALAAGRKDEYEAFAHYIDIMWEHENRPDSQLDMLVQGITDEVSAQIDCTRCANCCRSLDVGLEPRDIPLLADTLNLPPDNVTAQYVDCSSSRRKGEWGIMRASPCPFLNGKLCSIYTNRPQSCRAYPALTPDFRYLARDMMRGASRCPIIFNVVERLMQRLNW